MSIERIAAVRPMTWNPMRIAVAKKATWRFGCEMLAVLAVTAIAVDEVSGGTVNAGLALHRSQNLEGDLVFINVSEMSQGNRDLNGDDDELPTAKEVPMKKLLVISLFVNAALLMPRQGMAQFTLRGDCDASTTIGIAWPPARMTRAETPPGPAKGCR